MPKIVPDKSQVAIFDNPRALAAARASGAAVPIVVMLARDPWLMVIGSDSPAFALYDDGTVIYRTSTGYKSGKLDRTAREALTRSLNVNALAPEAGYYDASNGTTDQPTVELLFFGGAEHTNIIVNGVMTSAEARAQLPEAIVAAYDTLRGFSLPDATPWLPEKIEVMVWPYDHAIDAPIVWPKDWPGLDDPATRKRGEGSFSIYIPSARYEAVNAFLASRKEKGAVLIGGKKWSASIRLPFPQESVWMPSQSE
jgi:hypothetical protein